MTVPLGKQLAYAIGGSDFNFIGLSCDSPLPHGADTNLDILLFVFLFLLCSSVYMHVQYVCLVGLVHTKYGFG